MVESREETIEHMKRMVISSVYDSDSHMMSF